MARVVEHDVLNGRAVSMWSECGIQFRSNLLLYRGAKIELHEHSYPHVAMLVRGVFEDAHGNRLEAPQRLLIPAGEAHSFTRLDDEKEPAEVLCMWGE